MDTQRVRSLPRFVHGENSLAGGHDEKDESIYLGCLIPV